MTAQPTTQPAIAVARPKDQALIQAPIAHITPDPANPREDVGDVTELARSMEEAGLLQPIVTRRDHGRLIVVAGHRRLAAAQELGWTSVPVIVRREMFADDVLAAMLIENGQRQDLDPVEEARALRRLKADMGECSDKVLAQRIGRTQVHVSSRLALLSLPFNEQEQLRARQMNLGDAVRRGRIASGKVRNTSTGAPHLGIEHELAPRARARCTRLGHKNKGRNSVGGTACGECWESVIRADERHHLTTLAVTRDECPVCNRADGGDAA